MSNLPSGFDWDAEAPKFFCTFFSLTQFPNLKLEISIFLPRREEIHINNKVLWKRRHFNIVGCSVSLINSSVATQDR